MIKKQVLRLTVTIDQLHSMSNIDAMDRLDSSPIKINHLIKTIKRDLEPKAKQKNINLSYSLLEGNYIIPGDEDYLFKAISGICENAIIYTNDNGLVEITTLKQDNNLVIEVKDNGIGIDESDLEKIFDRFYKVNKARTSNSSATGLGLTMAKLIIEKHGGKITVESKIGVGSTFKIYLPIETVTS
jgi:signal transduction histidine kinase